MKNMLQNAFLVLVFTACSSTPVTVQAPPIPVGQTITIDPVPGMIEPTFDGQLRARSTLWRWTRGSSVSCKGEVRNGSGLTVRAIRGRFSWHLESGKRLDLDFQELDIDFRSEYVRGVGYTISYTGKAKFYRAVLRCLELQNSDFKTKLSASSLGLFRVLEALFSFQFSEFYDRCINSIQCARNVLHCCSSGQVHVVASCGVLEDHQSDHGLRSHETPFKFFHSCLILLSLTDFIVWVHVIALHPFPFSHSRPHDVNEFRVSRAFALPSPNSCATSPTVKLFRVLAHRTMSGVGSLIPSC
jgi:hypothetical protein